MLGIWEVSAFSSHSFEPSSFFSSLPRVFKTKQQSVSPCPIWSKPTPVKNTKPPGSQSSWPPSSQNNRFGYFLCTLNMRSPQPLWIYMDMSARKKQLQHVSTGCLCFTPVTSFIWGFTVNHLCNLLSAHFWFAYCNPREAILRWAACLDMLMFRLPWILQTYGKPGYVDTPVEDADDYD